MPCTREFSIRLILAATLMGPVGAALASPLLLWPGMRSTYGDVSHTQSPYSSVANPAAGAAALARGEGRGIGGAGFTASAGLEYGNLDNLFDLYNQITAAYRPSDSGTGGGPGQEPGDKPDGGINLGDILDLVDPDVAAAVEALADELATQTALLALISQEGYGKGWVSADVPLVLARERLGGAWTFGVAWSAASTVFGVTEPLDFDIDTARSAIEQWLALLPEQRPTTLPIGDNLILSPRPDQNAVFLSIDNDSSLLTKAVRTTELSAGYSRQAWSGGAGDLFVGATARAYFMQLSRLGVRFGDITDSEELFDAIRDADYRSDEALSMDLGLLWVGERYQLGAMVTNLTEPTFTFPGVNLDPYRSQDIIDFLQADQRYTLDRQLKLEASIFSSNRRVSGHIGYDVDPVTGPLGDRFQWLSLSAGFVTDSWWLPSARIGYRQNLAGTEQEYLSLGLTAFKFVNIDLSSSLDTVKIDGTTLPQGLMGSIGFQINW